jgi:hypothetical protein
MRKIFKISDNLITDYLNSRNLDFNRKKMVINKPIKFVNHFIWWFTNKREIFFYKINKEERIYFYQEIIQYKNKKYLIGGWHSNSKKVNLIHVLYFLKWQLYKNKKRKLNYDWVAVVKKNNSWILKLVKFLGYELVNKNEVYNKVIKNHFKVSVKNYFYLKLIVKN